jgi:hypothetical protein
MEYSTPIFFINDVFSWGALKIYRTILQSVSRSSIAILLALRVFALRAHWTDIVKNYWRLFNQTGVRIIKENPMAKKKASACQAPISASLKPNGLFRRSSFLCLQPHLQCTKTLSDLVIVYSNPYRTIIPGKNA